MKTHIIVGATALFAIALMILPAVSIADTFTAIGTVTDEKGNGVPGASVTLIDDSFRERGTTITDAIGNFKFTNVSFNGFVNVKAKVAYASNGTTYTNQLENMQWYDTSTGLTSFKIADTRLHNYPVSDHGYVWGVVMSNATDGKALDGFVYLCNDTATLTTQTTVAGGFELMAAPGNYEIYAIHPAGAYLFVSKRTKITILSSYSARDANPLMLVADQVTPTPSPAWAGPVIDQATPGPTPPLLPTPTPAPAMSTAGPEAPSTGVKSLPLVAALILGALMIAAGWAILSRWNR